MEEGFVLTGEHLWPQPTSWVEGPPVKSIWTGLKLTGRRRRAIVTARCRRCGYLEQYAPG